MAKRAKQVPTARGSANAKGAQAVTAPAPDSNEPPGEASPESALWSLGAFGCLLLAAISLFGTWALGWTLHTLPGWSRPISLGGPISFSAVAVLLAAKGRRLALLDEERRVANTFWKLGIAGMAFGAWWTCVYFAYLSHR